MFMNYYGNSDSIISPATVFHAGTSSNTSLVVSSDVHTNSVRAKFNKIIIASTSTAGRGVMKARVNNDIYSIYY